jgi:hypothetical protein
VVRLPLSQLNRGWTFRFDDDPDTILICLGHDPPYTKVKALDKKKNKEMCARYDADGDSFALMSSQLVTLVDPLTGKPLNKSP